MPSTQRSRGGIEKTLKISEVADKINSIQVGGGSGSGNELEFDKIDSYDSNNRYVIVIYPFRQYDGTASFSIKSGPQPLQSSTLYYSNDGIYVYLA